METFLSNSWNFPKLSAHFPESVLESPETDTARIFLRHAGDFQKSAARFPETVPNFLKVNFPPIPPQLPLTGFVKSTTSLVVKSKALIEI